MNKAETRKENIVFFLTGCLLGILCFVATYGVKILNVTYDGWLLNTDIDLMQHYIGWGHFRNGSWSFPIGLISSLSYPTPVSVIYTDSIPIVAVLFKILSPILPETFQYFGIYGLFNFMMMGGLSILLIHKFVESRVICVLTSVLFILSFPILQRTFYHTALSSQWLIILSLLLWVSGDRFESVFRKCLKWGAMGFLCVGIHSYYLPMAGAIMLFSLAEDCIVCKNRTGKLKASIINGILVIVSFCVMAIFNIWLLGGFYGGTSAIGGGIGTFESNLNTFINPLGFGISGIELPLYYEFQYEGFAYLGIGMLLLTVLSVIGIVIYLISAGSNLKIKSYIMTHYRKTLFAILFLLFFALAAGPMFTIGNRRILAIPLLGPVGKVADIFRSNGRFIWVSMYVLMLSVIVILDRTMRKSMKIVMICLAFILQVVDLSATIKVKQDYFTAEQTYVSVWDNPSLLPIIADKKEFILMDPNDTAWKMDIAYYAFKHGMKTNDFYFARSVSDSVERTRRKYDQELSLGKSREDAVYVFAGNGFLVDKYPDLVCYAFGDHVIGVKRK